jgi:hypothetical protein
MKLSVEPNKICEDHLQESKSIKTISPLSLTSDIGKDVVFLLMVIKICESERQSDLQECNTQDTLLVTSGCLKRSKRQMDGGTDGRTDG